MKEPFEIDQKLRVAVDIGGTFTDGVVSISPLGRIWVAKSPTTPDDPGEAVTTVIEDLLRQVARSFSDANLGTAPGLAEVVHGTTLITNTLIERKGAQTALVTTRGMRDVLDIGREWRYDIYDLEIELPKPLIEKDNRVEVDERLDARGDELTPLSAAEVDRVVSELRKLNVTSVAISLLHSYVNPKHEREIADRVKAQLPLMSVSLSSDLAREIKEFERTSTVVANAYVKPLVANYLRQLRSRIEAIQTGVPLRVMVSSGGFSSAESGAEAPILLLESGPAAGVMSALNTARQNGVSQVLAFDMGGTTAKACVAVGGEAPIAHSFECARVKRFRRGSGLPILIPSIELIEIGAGGGSIAYCNRLGLLNVGPESSGSVPGPACYGRGGSNPTVTDADLLLGYLNADNFLGGEMRLDRDAAARAMERLASDLKVTSIEAAWGICEVVNENMASAARIHIAENGLDPRDFTMIATGGAGPLHAVEVARKLRVPRVLIPIAAGAGSCLGMLAAPARTDRAWSDPRLLADTNWDAVAHSLADLMRESRIDLEAAGASDVEWLIGADMRYHGQGAEIAVSIPYEVVSSETSGKLLKEFESEYLRLYGRLVPNAAPQVITWRLVGRASTRGHHFEWGDKRVTGRPAPKNQPVHTSKRAIYVPGKDGYETVNVYDRYSIAPGTTLAGPLVLEERESTIVVAVSAEVTVCKDLTVSVLIKEFD